MKNASEMSVSISRAMNTYSMPVASTSAPRKPTMGEKSRRPKIHVKNTIAVANSAEGTRAASSSPWPSPNNFSATMPCQ